MNKKDELNTSLFTGEYYRDSAVSEMEKAAEAAMAIYEGVKTYLCKKKSCGVKLRRKFAIGQ